MLPSYYPQQYLVLGTDLFKISPSACIFSFQDYIDTEMLLCGENVNQENLLSYAREAADFATNYQLPSLDFAINHYGQSDVAMFDFTSMYASENAALVRERQRHQLLVALVGDSLLEVMFYAKIEFCCLGHFLKFILNAFGEHIYFTKCFI